MNTIRRGAIEIEGPPWRCPDATVAIYAIQANRDSLEQMCARTLNATDQANQVRYEPSTSIVLIAAQSIRKLHSLHPNANPAASLTYNEAAVWVSVHDTSGATDGTDRLYIPYIFADNGRAVAAGRETYGYPKENAEIRFEQASGKFNVTALQLDHGETGMALKPVLSCQRSGMAIGGGLNFSGDFLPNFKYADFINPIPGLDGFLKFIVGRRLDFVFVRQFPPMSADSTVGEQRLIHASAATEILSFQKILFGSTMHLADSTSHPMVSDLGLNGPTVPVVGGALIRMKFDLGPASFA
jgi:Acetoacetate decarboxylase (ADC)